MQSLRASCMNLGALGAGMEILSVKTGMGGHKALHCAAALHGQHQNQYPIQNVVTIHTSSGSFRQASRAASRISSQQCLSVKNRAEKRGNGVEYSLRQTLHLPHGRQQSPQFHPAELPLQLPRQPPRQVPGQHFSLSSALSRGVQLPAAVASSCPPPLAALRAGGSRGEAQRPAAVSTATAPLAETAPPGILQAAFSHPTATAVVDSSGAHSYCSLLLAAAQMSSSLIQPIVQRERSSSTTTAASSSSSSLGGADVALDASCQDGDGPRIAIFAKPSAEFVAALCAAWLAGGIAVPLCTTHPAAELLYVLQNSGASIVLGQPESEALLRPLAEQCGAEFFLLPAVAEAGAGAGGEDLGQIESLVSELDMPTSKKGALIIYTSGTTGRPKGVVHTLAGLSAQADMLVEAWGYSSTDRFLHVLPLHHVHGVMNALLAPLSAAATVEFAAKFSPGSVWSRWREGGGGAAESDITVFTGVPTHYVRLLQAYDDMANEDKSQSAAAAAKLRLTMCGSAACPEPLMIRWEEVTGHRLLERYGMTEFAMALANPLLGERRLGCVGFPLKGVQTKVVLQDKKGDVSGSEEEEEETEGGGELCVKSPGQFREYWQRPEATAEAFDEDGFFRTGDTVVVDGDGYFKILGRTSVDIIKMGGYKLSALEIEAMLLENGAIAECAVLGIPDKDYGEAVAAVVVQAKGSEKQLTLRDLKPWAMKRMAHYKVPMRLRVIDEMPRNAMGKVNKKELRKQLFPEEALSSS